MKSMKTAHPLSSNIRRATLLRVCMGLMGLTASIHAATLVEYDFENATVEGTPPNRVWTIYDQAGPPFTNATASEASRQTIASFNGGNALRFVLGGGGGGISLGQGAAGELGGDFSSGLVLQTTFQITSNLASATQTLFGKYGNDNEPGNRTFDLHINAGPATDPTGTQRLVQFVIYPDTGGVQVLNSNIRIVEGETYHITAIFNPFDGKISMSISGFETDYVEAATTASALADTVHPFVIGGRGDTGTLNRFFGYMDNVVIATVPEPSAGMTLLLGGAALCAVRLLRRKRGGHG